MGDLLQELGGALGLGGKQPSLDMSRMLPPAGSVPGFAGGMFGGEGQGPMERWDPLQAMLGSDPSPIPGADQGQNPADDIAVRAFKPKKRSIFGVIGDAILLNQGHKGKFFADRVYDKNMRRAFEGFTGDPMETVRRVATFDPQSAFKMYGTLADDQRLGRTQDRQDAIAEMKFQSMVGAMMGAANPNNYPAMRQRMQTMGQRLGYDMSYLPEEYDEEAIQQLRYGGMTVDQQIDNQRADSTAQSQNAYRQERLADYDAQRGEMSSYRDRRAGEIERHNRVMEARPVGSRSAAKPEGGAGERDLPGIGKVRYNDDKSRAIVMTKDGQRMHLERQQDGSWKRVR